MSLGICKSCDKDIAICIIANKSNVYTLCKNQNCICRKYVTSSNYNCKFRQMAKCIYINYANMLLAEIKENKAYIEAKASLFEHDQYALEIKNEEYNSKGVYCNMALICHTLSNMQNSRKYLYKIIAYIDKVISCVYKSDAKLYGGFIRDYYNYILEHRNKLKTHKSKSKIIPEISNIIFEYYDDYIPDITNDFKDIDILIRNKEQLEIIKTKLLENNFKFEEINDYTPSNLNLN